MSKTSVPSKCPQTLSEEEILQKLKSALNDYSQACFQAVNELLFWQIMQENEEKPRNKLQEG
ncbi:MAG: hypothetical protein MUE85_18775 [Microscillaceae bacterium]|jgi:hypothetical protein|nr:hypothetical protein [Microscillaceae bacterium]